MKYGFFTPKDGVRRQKYICIMCGAVCTPPYSNGGLIKVKLGRPRAVLKRLRAKWPLIKIRRRRPDGSSFTETVPKIDGVTYNVHTAETPRAPVQDTGGAPHRNLSPDESFIWKALKVSGLGVMGGVIFDQASKYIVRWKDHHVSQAVSETEDRKDQTIANLTSLIRERDTTINTLQEEVDRWRERHYVDDESRQLREEHDLMDTPDDPYGLPAMFEAFGPELERDRKKRRAFFP